MRVRVVVGWRREHQAKVLDACARCDGYLWDADGYEYGSGKRDGSLTEAARRSGVSKSTMWQRLNAERVDWERKRAASRNCWDRYRMEWAQYAEAYRVRYPGTEPIGLKRWMDDGWRTLWLSTGIDAMQLNTRSRHSARSSLESARGMGPA